MKTHTVIPAQAGIQRVNILQCLKIPEPKSLDSRLRGNDEI